ncbi:interleukin-9 receptor isoform X2 [Rattus rattus]|uniref:interleukin-9 receptor isoform X2 n=1 Tax=Rattus rattus TaxID=10117 RepID=UPI0013F32749|nr:interleukin-9 receptor isoform X2 [Rattus rattus]
MALGRCFSEGCTSEGAAVKQVSWFLIYSCVCSCVCWGVSVPAQEGGKGRKAGTFTCFSNSVFRIDCHWSAPEPGSRAWLLFTSNQVTDTKHKCTFWDSKCTLVLPKEEAFLPSDNFTITLHRCVMGREQVSLVDSQYLPRRHIKLDPPSDLQSNVSSERCVLTWGISFGLEPLITSLSYELAFKRQEEAWEARLKDRIVGVTRLVLEAIELNPDSIYEARLRVQMALESDDDKTEGEYYKSHWSEWSQSVSFPSPRRKTQGLLVPRWQGSASILVAVPIFLLLTGLIHLLFRLSPKVKRIFYQDVPSPEAFFHPLYTVYHGDFQTWIGVRRAGPQARQDGASTPSGDSESSIWEAIATLTYSPACSVQFPSLKWEATAPGFPGPPGSELVLPAGCLELEGQPSAYLPQEDWAPLGSARPPPLDSDSGSSDYCMLDCREEYDLSVFPEHTQSPEFTLAQPVALAVSSRA